MSKDIPNVSYFIQTNPYNYSASDYFRTFKDLHSSQKDILHGYWVKAIKTLQSCSEPVYIENGKRLIKIWKSPGNGLSEFWENQDQQESALDDLHAATKTARKRTFKSVQRHFGRAFNALDKNTSYEPSTFNESPEGPRPKREVKPVYYAEEDSMEDDSASQYSEERISSRKRPISEITGEVPSESSSLSSTTTSTAATSSSSKPKLSAKKGREKASGPFLQEPWKGLIEVALLLYHGKSVEFPEMPDLSHLTDPRKGLYMCAYENLLSFKDNNKNILCKKEASVALSCTLNLGCQELSSYFDSKFLSLASDAYEFTLPENKTRCILQPLVEILERHDVNFLRKKVRILMGTYTEMEERNEAVPSLWEPVLDVIEHLCKLVIRPSFGPMSVSEGDVVAEWKTVFNILLGGSNVFMKCGECVSESSKSVKAILDEEFDDFGKFGRKVDLIFCADGLELANCEFKIADATDMDVKIQNRKNIRLNRAIMESHKSTCGARMNMLYFEVQGSFKEDGG
ncbi:hypothetical protein BGX21_011121 [Mortierella sp. AD011]|nr:hypothetical protein BGX21_011121 [Mortierella sp. AD011]